MATLWGSTTVGSQGRLHVISPRVLSAGAASTLLPAWRLGSKGERPRGQGGRPGHRSELALCAVEGSLSSPGWFKPRTFPVKTDSDGS